MTRAYVPFGYPASTPIKARYCRHSQGFPGAGSKIPKDLTIAGHHRFGVRQVVDAEVLNSILRDS
jgi:hypothetical protein